MPLIMEPSKSNSIYSSKNEIDPKFQINGLCAFRLFGEQVNFCTPCQRNMSHSVFVVVTFGVVEIPVSRDQTISITVNKMPKKLIFIIKCAAWFFFDVFLFINMAMNRGNGSFAWYIMRLNWKLLKLRSQLVNDYVFSPQNTKEMWKYTTSN